MTTRLYFYPLGGKLEDDVVCQAAAFEEGDVPWLESSDNRRSTPGDQSEQRTGEDNCEYNYKVICKSKIMRQEAWCAYPVDVGSADGDAKLCVTEASSSCPSPRICL
uniref:Uncharacterized protein n=1 Tax=Chromera velia CCMP2878 TaxID=1169474 RepID=A0A0G4GJH9_9ALVE|eukprot:Cvel_22175.t1-p1 / transcript=Cvel_22175.t1 / gene=Cvel_22175 / organism=Chromera_velia_CCMP2878 / gene_product=hypothetical protein / transcript_product=hypothetical protein / location=Cvel_scaffold2152:30950-32104(-) / protein_length=106 / sequence_SO=supercontig / SO=protein_coding / is_pseudo=false